MFAMITATNWASIITQSDTSFLPRCVGCWCDCDMLCDLLQVGTRALKDNMTALGPMVLPLSEKLTFAGNMITRQLSRCDRDKHAGIHSPRDVLTLPCVDL